MLLERPGSYGNCPPSSLCFWLPLPGSQGPSCHWMGCGKTALMSRADISICLPDSSDACKLHQDFISPLVQHPALSGPCQPSPPTSDELHPSFCSRPASRSSESRGSEAAVAQLSLGCSGSPIPALIPRLSWEPDPFPGSKEGGCRGLSSQFPKLYRLPEEGRLMGTQIPTS